MKEIHTNYIVNEQTLALLPAKQIEYETLVLENDKRIYVSKPAIEIIKDSCLHYCSTYEGRRKAVMHHTRFKRKVPIPISKVKDIYAFPTHSPTDYDCSWIFYNHVDFVISNSQTRNTAVSSIIHFKNNQQVPMNNSQYEIEKQLERTAYCRLVFSGEGLVLQV